MKPSNYTKYTMMLLLVAMVLLTACSVGPGKYDTFAKCLTEKGATMYGTEWCPHCQNQKKAFGNSFQYIIYVDCDKNQNACIAAGVDGYPTWVVNGTNYPGEQNMYKLSQTSGCELVEDKI